MEYDKQPEGISTHNPAHHRVVADNEVVYEGYNEKEASHAFLSAGRNGAKKVVRFLNEVPVTSSKAVKGS